jgi:hypothetical protein
MLARRINLDFMRRPSKPWLGYLLLLLGATLLIHFGNGWRKQEQQTNDARSALTRLERLADRPVKSQAKPTISPEKLATIERELHRPWHELLAAVERAQMSSVQLLSIEPDTSSGRVLVAAQTENFANITAFGENLTRNGLHEVVLQSHLRPTDPPALPFRFVYTARWTESSARIQDGTRK